MILPLLRKHPACEDRVSVVDKNLAGAVVEEDAEVCQPSRQRPRPALPLLRIETPLHPAPVDRDHLLCLGIPDRESAVPVLIAEQIDIRIARPHIQLDLAGSGQRRRPGQLLTAQIDLLLPELTEQRQRLLDETASPDGELARQRHASLPVLLVRRVRGIRQSHPGDQHRLALILHIVGALRRVGIKPEIQHMEPALRRKGQRVPVHGADDVAVVISGIAAPREHQMLRAEHQNFLPADVLDARALPHIAKILEPRNLQLSEEMPAVQKVLRAVDQRTAVSVLRLRAENDVILSPLPVDDNLRIALVLRVVRMCAEQRQRILFRPAVVPELREAGIRMPRPVRIAVIPRIVQIDSIPDRHGGTGIGSPVVIRVSRHQADAQILPGDEILRYRVIPVLQPVHGAPRAPLIKQMPFIVMPDKPVRIVHQPGHRLQMKSLAIARLPRSAVQPPQLLRVLQHAILFLSCPLSHPCLQQLPSGTATVSKRGAPAKFRCF